jgi:hypothetical protein
MPDDNSILFLFHIPKTGGTSLREALYTIYGQNEGFIHLGPQGDRFRHEHKLKPLERFSQEELDRIRVLSGHYLSAAHEKLFPGRTIRRAILLREPARRILSQYNHAMRNRAKLQEKPIGFHEWYEEQALREFNWPSLYGRKLTLADKKFAIASVGHNYMAKFILDAMGDRDYPELSEDELVARVNDYLETFWHVGSIENLPASIARLEEFTGCRLNVGEHNKTGRFFFSRLTRHMKMTVELRQHLQEVNRADYSIYNRWCEQH